MKKLLLSLLMLIAAIALLAQQVPRDKVILEIGTGTWCQYCPGAAMGADDLIANGCQVAVIEYHNGDAFTNTASNARNTYYNVTGYPTAHFDGVLEYVGGSTTQSMYANYLPLYQQRIAIPSDFNIEMYGENTGQTYDIVLIVDKVNGSWGNLKVHLVLTESEIAYSWFGQDHLNFVERMMVPDYNGTTVDFSSTSSVTLELQFTKDASWVNSNCELVAFVQNDATKECLQGMKVALDDLPPLAATAGFACTSNTPCIATPVDFIDESGGQIISWNWTFEGGTPPVSTLQNPTVTYNSTGSFNVQQIVYDGAVYDTLLETDYIIAITAPVQPSTITGPTVVCEGSTGEVYSTPGVQWTTTYVWAVDPTAAGTITGSDTFATFNLTPGYLDAFQIKVRADNNCGTGTWSQPLNAASYHTPLQYTLSDGGGYCDGGQGIDLTVDGSETGISYELYLDNVATGQVLTGTGSSLDFGYQTEQGIFTCKAYTDYCDNNMIGNSYIYVIYQPTQAAAPAGSTEECNNHTNVTYTTTGATNATSYSWSLTPAAAGTITGTTTTAVVDWNDSFSGQAGITVTGVNSCFSGPVSNALNVIVNAAPSPAISGDNEVCDGDLGVFYSTALNAGNSYTWEIGGGTIATGAGTNEVTVNWGAPGTGYLRVTETTSAGCAVTTSNYDITIDNCTGIGDVSVGKLAIYPNPVKDQLVVEFSAANAGVYQVMIINPIGQVIYHQEFTNLEKQVIINTSGIAEGIYTLFIKTADSQTGKKFVKN